MIAGEHLLECLGVDLDAGKRRHQRRGAQVHEPRGAGADENEAAFDFGFVDPACEKIAGRNAAARIGRGKLEPEFALRVGGQDHFTGANAVDAGLLAEREDAAGAR